MRISSRGSVSMGPLGWLIVGPIVLAVYLAIGAVWLLMQLVALVFTAIASENRKQKALQKPRRSPRHGPVARPAPPARPSWPNIPPSG